VGDHPPITPVRSATEEELGGGATWLIYDYVTRHFLASLSPDCVLRKTKALLTGGGESFAAHGSVVVKPGFTTIMHWRVSSWLWVGGWGCGGGGGGVFEGGER
jgi:DNA topoisomerase-3